jgi:hypothetical protein
MAAACAPAFRRLIDLISSQPDASARRPNMIMGPEELAGHRLQLFARAASHFTPVTRAEYLVGSSLESFEPARPPPSVVSGSW